MTKKSSFNAYIRSDIISEFKLAVENPSAEIERFMEQRIQAADDRDERLDELEAAIADRQEEIEELDERRREKKDALESLRIEKQSIEKQIRERKESDDMEKFLSVAAKHRGRDGWREPEDIPDYWPEALGMEREKLFDMMQDELDEEGSE